MNNILGSSSPTPIDDALALNFASLGFFTVVNNLWTWVAVITAAVSYWRIRTTSFPEKYDHQQPRIDRNPSGSRAQPSANTCVETQSPILAAPSVCSVKGVDGVTEGAKFTLYYYREEEMESDGVDGDGEATVVKEWRVDDGDDDGVSCCREWWDWERVTMRARIGEDMGMRWYRYQDLTVVNGNVVRLWDECRRRSQKSCCYSWSSVD